MPYKNKEQARECNKRYYEKNKKKWQNYGRKYNENGLRRHRNSEGKLINRTKPYKSRGEYVIRAIVKGKNNKIVYGMTIPKELVKKYDLERCVFKIRVTFGGKFVLYTRLKKWNTDRFK